MDRRNIKDFIYLIFVKGSQNFMSVSSDGHKDVYVNAIHPIEIGRKSIKSLTKLESSQNSINCEFILFI